MLLCAYEALAWGALPFPSALFHMPTFRLLLPISLTHNPRQTVTARNERPSVFRILKAFSKREYAEQFLDGNLYMNTLF